jgi:two-component system chemotaxis response regulator CheY
MAIMKKLRVLVVDDSSIIRKIISKTLKELGTEEIAEAQDGVDALIKLKICGRLDLILLDWLMPQMDGLEFLKKLKQDPLYREYREIPVIMVASDIDKAKVLEAFKAGANNFLAKPFSPALLEEKISQTLGQERAAPLRRPQ